MLAMVSHFGHTASQARVLVQLPKPSSSILATIALARRAASTRPCGRRASCDTFEETKSMAEPFLQAATQAPHPMQEAQSMASSASSLGMRMALASCGAPVRTVV